MPGRAFFIVPVALVLACGQAQAQSSWFSGDWHLRVGATVFTAPDYEGAREYLVGVQPLFSVSRAGTRARFSSRNDNISIGLVDTGDFRAGPTAKLVFERDADTSADLAGLDPVRFGGEAGVFAEVYPTDWLRVRGEVRHGIRAHEGIVADIAADAFFDVTPEIRVSGGPRASFASSEYFDAYYGVDAGEAAASGLAQYDPGNGVKSLGLGGAVTWRATERIETSLFGEYARLTGPAADSSLVRQRGSPDQFTAGVSATYRFDFSF